VNGLPLGWSEVALGDVTSPETRTVPAADSGMPYLGLDGVEAGTTRIVSYAESGRIRGPAKPFGPRSILYARLRPYLNKVCAPDREGVSSTEFIVFAASSTLDSRYLLYLLNSQAFVDFANANAEGIERPRLSWQRMRGFRFGLPPLAEQRRIVAAIEEDFSRSDAARSLLRRTETGLGKHRAASLVRITSGWDEQPLGEFARVYVGATPKRQALELWGGGIPWVSSGEVAFCRITSTRETISDAALSSPDRLHPPGTVLLAMIGEGKTRGQAAILDVAAAHNQNSAAIRLDTSVCTPEWIYYVLMARYEETRRTGVGAQQPALNGSRVAALRVPLPPIEEQRRLVAQIESQLSVSAAVQRTLQITSIREEALRRAILARALRGELVSQDPSEEPASVLLERIAAERTTAPKPTRDRKAKAPA
jgi:type I restriction enzyme S subunit